MISWLPYKYSKGGNMDKIKVAYTDYLPETIRILAEPGALLVSSDSDGKSNVMAIGWGMIGVVWGKPIFQVLVRPSRFTYELLGQVKEFTVNIPYPEMRETVMFCGTISGRDCDKFAERNLILVKSETVSPPVIAECGIHYECRVVHTNDIIPGNLSSEIMKSAYSAGDYHRVYFGQILKVSADVNLLEHLK